MKILKWLMVIVLVFTSSANYLMAQCAMCKASVETNVNEDGIGLAARLNAGILYLFVIPYISAMVIAFLWYKKSKENARDLEDARLRRSRIAEL